MTASAPPQDQTPVQQPEVAAPSSGASRLGWLDALRGIAALAVVYTHLAFEGLSEIYRITSPWVIAGTFGVLTFFIISGYIVPASLERKGSIRSFWISRGFRLYPLWILALVAVDFLVRAGLKGTPQFYGHWKALLAAELTMLQELVRIPSVLNVMWTLSYEMAFYFMVVALFAVGAHRRSAEISVSFTLASLVGGGGLIPSAFLLERFGWKAMLVGVIVCFVLGLALSVSGRRALALPGALLLGVMAVLLLVLNEDVPPWFGLLLPATMFVGTAIYRAEHGQIPRWKAAVAIVTLLVGAFTSALLNGTPPGASLAEGLLSKRSLLITFLLVPVAFAIGMRLRHRRMPRVLAWLGLVSYSTYLLHPLIPYATPWFTHALPFWQRAGTFALWMVVLLGLAALTYRFVEAPSQRLGRRLIKAMDARFGADRAAHRN